MIVHSFLITISSTVIRNGNLKSIQRIRQGQVIFWCKQIMGKIINSFLVFVFGIRIFHNFLIISQEVYLLLKSIKRMLARQCGAQQRQLQCDLDKLMKDMRQCQQLFQNVLHHTQRIVRNAEEESQIFVNEDIILYRSVITKISALLQPILEEYSVVLVQYASFNPAQDASILLKRVVHRLLDYFLNTISSNSTKNNHLMQQFMRVKVNCQKIIQQNIPNKPYHIIKAVTEYQFKKIKLFLQLLKHLTDRLENGEVDDFSQMQSDFFQNDRTISNNASINSDQRSSINSFKIMKIKPKQKLLPPKPQSQKPKLYIQPKGRTLFDSLKQVIELNRHEFLQDYNNFSQHTRQQLFREMLLRNKANSQAITGFQSKRKKIEGKIKIRATPKSENSHPITMNHNHIQDTENILDSGGFVNNRKKSLLLHSKLNEKPTKLFPSEIFRKTSKFEQTRLKMRSYNRDRIREEQQKPATSKKQEHLDLEQEKTLDQTSQKLPILNKRAQSMDQTQKNQCETIQHFQLNTLSNSLKINQDSKLRSRLQKIEIFPAKIRIQLKSSAICPIEMNRRLGRVGEFSKYLYF